MNDNTIQLVPNKSDAEMAEEYRKELVEAYKPICALLTDAAKNKFIVNVICGMGDFAEVIIKEIQVLKRL